MHKEILKLFSCVSHLIYLCNIFHILENIFQTGSSAGLNKMTFEQTPGGSGPGSPPEEEEDAGEVVTMVDVLKDGRDMEENAKVHNEKYPAATFAYFRQYWEEHQRVFVATAVVTSQGKIQELNDMWQESDS